MLSVIPDTSGASQVAALGASILGGIDLIMSANIVGQIQETGKATKTSPTLLGK